MVNDRKLFGRPMGMTAQGWLAKQSMPAYNRWRDWLYESSKENQEILMSITDNEKRRLIREAYERDEQDKKRQRRLRNGR